MPPTARHELPADEKNADLDLKNSQQLFAMVWAELEAEIGRENLRFPKEIMWLGGAPGAGKGTNTPFIMRERGITAPPIVMSSLLDNEEMRALIDRGQLVGDREVVAILLRELLKPEYESGVVVDGFPRTAVQCGVIRMIYQKMMELRREFYDTPIGDLFRRPIFRITVLYASEEVAIERQLQRGREVEAYNRKVRETGQGQEMELRVTDTSLEHARERYRIFREQTFDALQRLRDTFHYHFVDANGSLEEVEYNIIREFHYQSSVELAEDTYDSIRNIPLPTTLTEHARQELVRRLDRYRHRHGAFFARIVTLIEQEIVPVLRRHALAGHAVIRVESPDLDQPNGIDMVIDVLSERGFRPTAICDYQHIPIRVDEETGSIISATRKIWHFEINFKSTRIRRYDE
ncbi:MAG: nucleoside monophosphate kinase [Planctomycetota bacterium]|nr:MAG: nucleoside monophosphate kinase [Planctomycetota bacterium]